MPQSPAPQPETQPPAPSQSQAQSPQAPDAKAEPAAPLPTRQVGTPAKKPKGRGEPSRAAAPDEQAKQRAEQVQKRIETEKRNPFSRENRAARMQDVLNGLREDRGVAQPRTKADGDANEPKAAGSSDAAHGTAQPNSQPDHGVARGETVTSNNEKPAEVPEWYRSEQKAQAALAKAEAERQQSEKARAEAEAAVKRLADAKDDPIQFMAEAGMTKDEWNAYVANGGQLSPEQKKLRAMAENMAKMQERLDAAEKNAQQQQEQARVAAEDAGFAQELQAMTYLPHMGGVQAVRARQALLSQKTGQAVSLRDAAQHLEQEMGQGLQRLLQNEKIRNSLNLDVNTSPAGQAGEPPRTLNNSISAQSSHQEAKPHPLDFAAKRKLWAQRVEQDRKSQTGR